MNYLLLAAGRGTRMNRLSTYLQKCMYPVLDRPFLELTLESVIGNRRFDPSGDRVVIVIGHLGGQVTGYFGDSWRGVRLGYVIQTEAMGTAHAVALGYGACRQDEPVIVVQGDVWAEPEYFEALVDHPLQDLLSVHPHSCGHVHEERVDVAEGRVLRAWRGSGPCVECGIWKFSPAMVARMPGGKVDEHRALPVVQAAIEDGVPVGAVTRETWVHLGGTEPSTAENLRSVVTLLAARGSR